MRVNPALRCSVRLLLGALLAVPVPGTAQSQVTLPTHVGADGAVTFDAPVPVPWDSLVPAELRAPALEGDPTRRARLHAEREMFGFTEVPFPVALPPALASRRYYLMDSSGIHEIRPAGLVGTVRVFWRGESDHIDAIRVFGHVRAAPPAPGSQGFVLVTTEPAALEVEATDHTADALLTPHGEPYAFQGTPFWRITRQYGVRQTAPRPRRWVWVQWAPDAANVEGGCTRRFALFHLEPEPVMVAAVSDGCDA